jgi:hypothetical protein
LSQCRHTRHYCWNVHHHRAGHLGCHHEDRNCHRDGAVARETMYTVLSLLSLHANDDGRAQRRFQPRRCWSGSFLSSKAYPQPDPIDDDMSVYQDLPNLTRFPDSRFFGHLDSQSTSTLSQRRSSRVQATLACPQFATSRPCETAKSSRSVLLNAELLGCHSRQLPAGRHAEELKLLLYTAATVIVGDILPLAIKLSAYKPREDNRGTRSGADRY